MEILQLSYNFLVLITLIILVWQTFIQKKVREATTLEATYDRYIEFDKLIIDYPHLQLYTVRPEVYNEVAKLNPEELQKRAYIELILDCHELMFLKEHRSHYYFQEDYLRVLLANPHVKEYWTTMRGNYRNEFVEQVNSILLTMEENQPPVQR